MLLQLLKKSVIVADFEKKDTVPPYKESRHAAKLKRRVSKHVPQPVLWYLYVRERIFVMNFVFVFFNAMHRRRELRPQGMAGST